MKTGPLPSTRNPMFYQLMAHMRIWEPSLGQRNLREKAEAHTVALRYRHRGLEPTQQF